MIVSNFHNYNRAELNQTGVYEIHHISKPDHFYIGSASKHDKIKYRDIGFLQRWRNHLSCLRRGVHNNKFLQRVVNKYGIEGIRFRIVEVVVPEMCIIAENKYLAEYRKSKLLYNSNVENASRLGAKHTDEARIKIGKSRKKKKVFQFSFDGKMVREYDCFYSVLKDFPGGTGTIYRCLMNIQQTAFGYIWSYNNEFKYKPFNKSKTVIQYDISGRYINEFRSSGDAVIATGIARASINKCCLGKRRTAGGFKWAYKN